MDRDLDPRRKTLAEWLQSRAKTKIAVGLELLQVSSWDF